MSWSSCNVERLANKRLIPSFHVFVLAALSLNPVNKKANYQLQLLIKNPFLSYNLWRQHVIQKIISFYPFRYTL